MIDAERMLGSLVRNAMSRGSGRRRGKNRSRGRSGSGLGRSLLGGAGKGALAMGALGVAIAAFEHFTNQEKTSAAFAGAKPATPQPPLPPLPPLPDASSASPSLPPPPPPGSAAMPPTPSPGINLDEQSAEATQDSATTQERSGESLLMVRAMIAAANADHEVDEEERNRILDALDSSDLGAEERQFLLTEIESPIPITALAAEAATPDLARQVYLASLMVIEIDTAAERAYLARLARELRLSAVEVEELEEML